MVNSGTLPGQTHCALVALTSDLRIKMTFDFATPPKFSSMIATWHMFQLQPPLTRDATLPLDVKKCKNTMIKQVFSRFCCQTPLFYLTLSTMKHCIWVTLVVSNFHVFPCWASARLQSSERCGNADIRFTWVVLVMLAEAASNPRQKVWGVEGAKESHYFCGWCEDIPTELLVWWRTPMNLLWWMKNGQNQTYRTGCRQIVSQKKCNARKAKLD